MSRSVAFSTSPPGRSPAAARRRGTPGASIVVAAGVRLPADDADPAAGRDALVARGSRGSGRDASRGWPGRLRSWKRTSRIGRGAAAAMPQHSLPTRTAGSPSAPTIKHRLLEARVEAGEVGEVGAVLAVGPDDEVVVAALVHRARAGAPSGRRRSSAASSGSAAGIPKSGSGDRRRAGRGRASSAHAVTPPGVHGRGAGRPALDRRERSPRDIVIHGPISPSGHCTRTSASSASPSPTCSQPSSPPAWPPPTVTSRTVVRPPTRTSTHAPIGVDVWRRLLAAARRSSGPSARAASRRLRRRCARASTGSRAVDDDEVEQPVEVEVDERGATRPLEADDARRPRRPPTNVPSGWPMSRLLGSSRRVAPPAPRRCPW